MNRDEELVEYLDDLAQFGAAIVVNTPTQSGTALKFAEHVGIVREVAFGKIHDVFNNPDGYNVAHTASALPPHTDLASYPYPPSGQLLHYIVNDVEGGATILVDGWHIAETIKATDPDAYQLLCQTRIPFQIFSKDKDTQSLEPIIGLHPDGRSRIVRFSNQTALPFTLAPELIDAYYQAYQSFGRLATGLQPRIRKASSTRRLCGMGRHDGQSASDSGPRTDVCLAC